MSLARRDFLKASLTAAGMSALPQLLRAGEGLARRASAKAESVIFIWLPGGVCQQDTWDVKEHTPFERGMRGSQLLSTCPSIPTSVDGLRFGAGLEQLASVMHRGTVLRSLASDVKFGAVHLKAQYAMMTGFLFPAGVRVPSLGAAIARTLGPIDARVPPYIYIGRDIDTSDTEKQFISEYIGPGFYGVKHAPFMIPDPERGLATLEAAADMSIERIDRRLSLLKAATSLTPSSLNTSQKFDEYLNSMQAARAMMDSPVKRAFNFRKEEKPETLAAYQSHIAPEQLLDKKYYFGNRFGNGLLLARRLVEVGARFVQVEYQYGPFRGFDTHENGATRIAEMKKQIDAPIAQLIRDLAERNMLDKTLVVVASEFGRTIANQPKAGIEPIGFAESQSGEELVIEDEKMYGHHGHFSSAHSMLFFGGGFKPGLVYGRTADRHPMLAVENPVTLTDMHATIYKALGIPPDTYYVTEGRPVHVTKDGRGKPVDALLN